SRSMDARDVDPSRLGRARRELQDLGQMLEGDRVGLVVFAGGAFPRLPLTNDFKAVQLVVDEAGTDTFDTQGSNLGAAIDAGLELLERSEGDAGRALLVLSDGETHDADRALEAARRASDLGVAVYAMGIGVEEAPIPLRDGSFLQYEGKVATTSPDFEILRQVAELTGGAFVTSNASSRDMEGLYRALRTTVRAVDRDAQQRQTWASAFQAPLALAALAWLGAAWLGDGRRRYGAALALLLAAGLAFPTTASAEDLLAEADALYRAEKYPQAAEKLLDLTLEHPDDAELQDRLAAARYRAGDYEGAARAWEQSARAGDSDALFNAGNAHYMAGRLEEALERYDQVLTVDPENAAALRNKDMVGREIASRRAQKPPPPPKPDDGPRDDGQGGAGQEQDEQDGSEGGQEQGDPSEGGQQDQQDPSQQEPQPGQGGGEQQEQQDQQNQQGGSSEGTDEEQPDSEPVDPSQVTDGQGEQGDQQQDTTAQGEGSQGEDEGPMTQAQADRLLESIDEGQPRTLVQGLPGGKPW
ncbi:MAG: VWA domain-containing protein, partial [Myxococcales bacterium]|nr:VWA domain-containing protein [Myxococcales bacterium]